MTDAALSEKLPGSALSSKPAAAEGDPLLFWGCFIALVTTAFGFIARMFLIGTWQAEFELDPAQAGRLAGIGIWPFAVSIIGFSLFIDRIGYKVSMIFAFLGHLIWAVMGVSAYFVSQSGDKDTAYALLYWGSLILGLANGTVEAFINPVVATMFNREKTKWLNILHAGWPGGLVVAGIATIFIDALPWGYKVGLLAIPAVAYFVILIGRDFPVQEREAAGVTYKEMLSEFGVLGAAVVGFLVTLQLMDFFAFAPQLKPLWIVIGVGIVVGFAVYTQSLGSTLLFVLIVVMMPLATTEIGTDGWITSIMESVAKDQFHPGWILVYTSAIMMVLRFFAGPIVHNLSPLGLLAASSALAIAGLYLLSSSAGAMIFIAATLYGIGKTFFWPTMLGVVSEQTPKGGALTLNAISGIGMLAVGTLGFPYIGTLQATKQIEAVAAAPSSAQVPNLIGADGSLTVLADKSIYEIISYKAIDDEKLIKLLPETSRAIARREEIALALAKSKNVKKASADDVAAALKMDSVYQAIVTSEAYKAEASKLEGINSAKGAATQGALANMAVFPAFMLAAYVALIVYFQAQGGYKAITLGEHDAPSKPTAAGEH